MVVVVIVGVLIAVVAARLKGTSQRAALRGASREIVSACNVARQTAISTERDVWIKFDVNKDIWRIDLNVYKEEEDRRAHYDSDARYDLEMTHKLPPKIFFAAVSTEEGAYQKSRQGDDYPLIIFHSDGTATQAAVVLESERGRQMTIEVSSPTGRPEVYSGGPRDFSQKLVALGLDPSAFANTDEGIQSFIDGEGPLDPRDPNYDPRARQNLQAQDYYKPVLDRILGARGYGGGGYGSGNPPPIDYGSRGSETTYGR